MSGFERVRLAGGPEARGRTHGERFADEIADTVEVYLDRFAYHGADRRTVREQAEAFIPLIEAENPDYAAEMRAVAEGSGVPLVDVTAINVRYEVLYSAYAAEAEGADTPATAGTDGCTSFGILPERTADGHTYVGQNWDWIAPICENLLLIEVHPDDGASHLAMTEAGIVGGKIGVNEHGIGVGLNGLASPSDGEEPFRKPCHVRLRELLSADRFDKALLAFTEGERACSANVVVGHADGEVIDLETAPETVGYLYPDDGVLTHANHFETDAAESLLERRGPSTLYRSRRLRRRLEEADRRDGSEGLTVEAVQEALCDHFAAPASVCKHVDESLPPEEHGQTNASFVIDLNDRTLIGTRGPPCEGTFETYRLV